MLVDLIACKEGVLLSKGSEDDDPHVNPIYAT
jgi:hypothetical protein